MLRKVVLPEPVELGEVNACTFEPLWALAEEFGERERASDIGPRISLLSSFVLEEGKLGKPVFGGYSPDRESCTRKALEPIYSQARGWLHSVGTLNVEYTAGNVRPGKTLLPPPTWHIDGIHRHNVRGVLVSNIDPTLVATGSLRGQRREKYIKALEEATDQDKSQAGLREVIEDAVAGRKLCAKPMDEYQLFGLNDRIVHRPQINRRKFPIFREVLIAWTSLPKEQGVDK